MTPDDNIYDRPEEDVGLDGDLPFDPETPEQPTPAWLWVRHPSEPDTVVWRRHFMDALPWDGVEYLFDTGVPPGGPAPGGSGAAVAARRAAPDGPAIRFHRAKVDLTPHDMIVDQTSGVLKKAQFLVLAKSGAFPAFKYGKRWCARLSDVEAWVSTQLRLSRNQSATARTQSEEDEMLDEIRKQVGLRTRGGR